jgi:hypothetical protein
MLESQRILSNMESQMNPAPLEARLALQEAARAHETLARRARPPVWYNAALGLLIGALTAAMAGPTWLLIAAEALFCVGLVLLITAYRRKTGLWINGYRAGRTRVVAVSLAVATAALMLAGVWLKREHGLWQAPLVCAPIVAALVTVAGYVWQAAFRADLADQARTGDRS